MSKVIVFESIDGICICNPAPELFDPNSLTRNELRNNGIDFNSDDEIMDWVKNKDVPLNANSIIVDINDFPTDNMFTNSWEILNNSLNINMGKARIIWMDYLCDLRHKKFIELGFPYKLNTELEDSIIDQNTRQLLTELRNMPQAYDLSNAQTIDELKTMIPDILK